MTMGNRVGRLPSMSHRTLSFAHLGLWTGSAVFVAIMAALVVGSSSRPEVPTYEPEVHRAETGAGLTGPVTYTIDGRSQDAWRFFRFEGGGVVSNPEPTEWDLAVRRHRLIVNGGPGFEGLGGIAVLGPVPFDSVVEAPTDGYLTTRVAKDSAVAGLKWYSYGFSSHMLTPRGDVYAVRTADGRYAKVEILSYYCTAAQPGCLTIRYSYQGDGSRRLVPSF